MIKEINSIKFSYKRKLELDEETKNKVYEYWNKITKETDMIKEGKILIVSNLIEKENNYEIELKETTFSYFMYARKTEDIDIKCMFSGAYVITKDNYLACVLNNMYKGNKYEILNLVGGMSDVKDIINGEYSSEENLKREFKEELGWDIDSEEFTTELKYIKCPSEKENPFRYNIGTIYEIKTSYTKEEMEELFSNNEHDNEIKELVFFTKDNYKDIYNYEHKKEYMPELWERIFE